jgi:hypothetical protein
MLAQVGSGLPLSLSILFLCSLQPTSVQSTPSQCYNHSFIVSTGVRERQTRIGFLNGKKFLEKSNVIHNALNMHS